MPIISIFYGITIEMYFGDHAPPHFHARYAGEEALLRIDSLSITKGRLPPGARRLVLEWALEHRAELLENWRLASKREPLRQIAPLE